MVSFPESVTFLTCFALFHEIKVSDGTKKDLLFKGSPLYGGVEERGIAPAGVRRFYYFAFDFINFAVLLYAGRERLQDRVCTAAAAAQPRRARSPRGRYRKQVVLLLR
mgnify:CR=1 FL=1